MAPFVARFPKLFHLTRRTALPGIERNGLLPASTFLSRQSSPANGPPNRDGWTGIPDAAGHVVWLRWQNLRDHSLVKRLPDTITPAQWREFINAMVFLFPAVSEAEKLRSADKDVAQVVICYRTDKLLEAGCDLRFCRWNNGYLDRSLRAKAFSDYRAACDWARGDKVQEITVVGGIPANVPFEVVTT